MGRALRVLIVEDEAYIGLDIANELCAHGIRVIGPVRSQHDALQLIGDETIDAAVLDIKLGDADGIAVADAPSDRGIPFVFLTGYSESRVPKKHRDRPFFNKPYPAHLLVEMLKSL